uniref:AMP deaminase n=1 Tax=Peronospora matthiolae TaxID=2874970 RepID=A0AAV1TFW6_9STRA
MDNPPTHALEHEDATHFHGLHPLTPDLSPLAMHADVLAAAANAAAADGEDDDVRSQRTQHDGRLKACILEKVAWEKRLRHLPETAMDDLDAVKDEADAGDLFLSLPEPYGQLSTFQRVVITSTPDEEEDRETGDVCELIRKCVALRKKWITVNELTPSSSSMDAPDHGLSAASSPRTHASGASSKFRHREEMPYRPFDAPVPETTQHDVKMVNGVVMVYDDADAGEAMRQVGTMEEYYDDLFEIQCIVNYGPMKTLAFKRLQVLEARFNLHMLLNSERELVAQKAVPHRDFYNVRKVDTHVHHSACMNQKHLLRFIKSRLRNSPGRL